MIITYFGKQFLKLSYGDTVVGVNAPSKDAKGSKLSTFGADIAIATSSDPDVSGADTLSYGDRVPFVINTPGSYEVKGVFVSGGFLSDVKGRRENAYVFSLEGMSVAVLGASSTTDIPGDTREILSNPDILILPLGGDGLSPKDAAKLALSLEPLIIIPVGHGDNVKSDDLKTFLKEAGEESPIMTDKLTLKKKDLEGKDGSVFILTPEK